MKQHYDRHHQSQIFNSSESVYLKLHKGYAIPSFAIVSPKLSQQLAGPFRIVERVGSLAYRLQLPPNWRIHDVISVDHLEPYHFDTFARRLPSIPDVVDTHGPQQPSSLCAGDTALTITSPTSETCQPSTHPGLTPQLSAPPFLAYTAA